MFSTDFEELLDRAAQIDERLNNRWMNLMDDEEYQTLYNFFLKENFVDSWEDEALDDKTVKRNLRQVLAGKDKAALIRYAFALGRLVGKAEQILIMEGSA